MAALGGKADIAKVLIKALIMRENCPIV